MTPSPSGSVQGKLPEEIEAAIEDLIGQSFHTGIMRALEASPEHLRSAYTIGDYIVDAYGSAE